jgi:hypothetical protein
MRSQEWWYILIISALEAEAGRWKVRGQPGLHSKSLPQTNKGKMRHNKKNTQVVNRLTNFSTPSTVVGKRNKQIKNIDILSKKINLT